MRSTLRKHLHLCQSKATSAIWSHWMWTPGCSLPHTEVFLSVKVYDEHLLFMKFRLRKTQPLQSKDMSLGYMGYARETPEHIALRMCAGSCFSKCAQAALVYPAWPQGQSLATFTLVCVFFYESCSREERISLYRSGRLWIWGPLIANSRPAQAIQWNFLPPPNSP